jgi:ferredoxin
MAEIVRVAVDHNKCVGTTICVLTVPKVFALDEKGQSIVVDPAGDTMERLLFARDQCPQGAISVETEHDPEQKDGE